MKYYSAMKKKAVMPFLSAWMNLEDTMLNKINQTEEEKYCYYLPDTWHLNKSNSQNRVEGWSPRAEVAENEESFVKGHQLPAGRVSSEEPTYHVVIMVNATMLHT